MEHKIDGCMAGLSNDELKSLLLQCMALEPDDPESSEETFDAVMLEIIHRSGGRVTLYLSDGQVIEVMPR